MYTPPRKLSNSELHLFFSLTCTCSKHEPRPSKKTIQRHDTTYKRITIISWCRNYDLVTRPTHPDWYRQINSSNSYHTGTCNSSIQNITDQTNHNITTRDLETSHNNHWPDTGQLPYHDLKPIIKLHAFNKLIQQLHKWTQTRATAPNMHTWQVPIFLPEVLSKYI